jgi:hypothetical protein
MVGCGDRDGIGQRRGDHRGSVRDVIKQVRAGRGSPSEAGRAELRWTPLSSARSVLVSFGWVMAVVLERGGRRDGNDNWSL